MNIKIGIFGGTFDPFTRAHREIVKQALQQKIVDFVYICPTIVTWHRKNYKPWLTDSEKVMAIEALLGNDPIFKHTSIYKSDLRLKSIVEKNKELKSRFLDNHRFIDTLLNIKCMYDDGIQIYPIIGSDEYQHFSSWNSWKSIIDNSSGLIVAVGENGCGRDGKKIDCDYLSKKTTLLRIGNEFSEISATKIRESKKMDFSSYISAVLKKINTENDVLLKTPIFSVRKGQMTQSGLEPVLVDAPDWVTIIAKKGSKLLLEKQHRYGSQSIVEEFPCGMVEKNESPLDAAVRELEEETGYKIIDKGKIVSLGSVNPNPAFMTNTMHYFYVDLDEVKYTKKSQKLDKHEDIKFYFKDNEAFCRSVLDNAKKKDSKVPALLVTALTLCAFYVENKEDQS